ncbi:MAG: UDP-N-acetylmuramoyl-L-alanyl-D-glutamate--2,6-diaminopimelate ligase [Aliihoeflea sp.]|uniref:UDP-N-acetylmuramoyl-L-alanyl-D-glutamate--2, 6-diaminopimelate ligase n=1 Tax=Aliihoeflea sp. TaxID=2608088 RepID=UPI0040345930
MKLADLAPAQSIVPPEAGAIEVKGFALDSRKVEPGYVFAAFDGAKMSGAKFVSDAVARGATAILAARGTEVPVGVPLIETTDPRRSLSLALAAFYGAQPQTMVAVTGTAGKTSVASFARQIWAHEGHGAASIGTTGVISPGFTEYGSLTTPDPVALHQLLKKLAGEGVTHAAMEASSHGLDQRRLDGVKLSAAGFTNLGRDHMDYHATLNEYFDAKMRLFDTLMPKSAPAVIFADDPWSARAIDDCKAAGLDVLTVGRAGNFLELKRVEHGRHRQRTEICHDGTIYEVDLPLAGEFQVSNALVAAGLCIATGTPVATAMAALRKLEGASGRLELVGTTKAGAPVYVDYAHKPEALENVLSAVRPFTTGKVVVVFGCGGDRDKGKRPIMGEIASRLADRVIVTDDNPRSEVPATIRAAIMEAVPGALEIGDRRTAIREAVASLGQGDTLIVAGKGHEEGQTVGDVTLPFSDHEEVRAALRESAA